MVCDGSMHRRMFLKNATACAAAGHFGGWIKALQRQPSPVRSIRLAIRSEERLGTIPTDFMGLGYEISSVATPGVLSARNDSYVALVRQLGTHGVIRVGGNTSDYSSYGVRAHAVSAPKQTVINESGFHELAGFLDATGWSLIWGLNLGNGSVNDAVTEARAVAHAVGGKLLAFEIGNEPDLYMHEGHRTSYSYEQYLSEYQRYKTAVRASLPHASFAGPDVAGATDWVERFAKQAGHDLRLLTHHYYREGQNPTSSSDKLLRPDPRLTAMLTRMRAAAETSGVPYRICETNSFSGGGRPGVSDTFAAALWVLDYLCVLAWHGAAGVNVETGINQLDFISPYSPIVPNSRDQSGAYQAAPEYYGMLAFAQGCRGERIALNYDASDVNLTAYATADTANTTKSLRVVIINKDTVRDADAQISTESHFAEAQVQRLSAPSLQSKTGITFGGVTVSTAALWRGHPENLRVVNNACTVRVAAGSAAAVSFA